MLCVIDDAQWLDDESADVLSFVARRLLADRVGMLFALRETTEPDPRLQALPGLRLAGLPEQDAYELLRDVDQPAGRRRSGGADRRRDRWQSAGHRRSRPRADPGATGRTGAAARAAARRSPARRPVRAAGAGDCPRTPRRLLLLAAADQPGRGDRLWRAAAALGIPESGRGAGGGRRTGGLLAGGAVLPSAGPVGGLPRRDRGQRRQAHRALAAACDPELDAVPRAWHLAAAAAGPDEGVAAALEAAAERAGSRGGCAAAAALLERAALLTPDEERRAERQLSAAQAHVLAGTVDRADALLVEATPGLRDPRSTAQATRLKGRIRFHRGQVAEAASTLAGAARRLRPLDPRAARDALLSALEATVFAGWAPAPPSCTRSRGRRGELPPTGDPRTRPPICCCRAAPRG